MNCPCHSEIDYFHCCGRYHRGEENAPNPEALMRSRYSAFALGSLGDYLIATWDPRTLDPALDAQTLDQRDSQWLGLELLSAEWKGARGTVEFKASYRPLGCAASAIQVLHERSRFRCHRGAWLYQDGIIDPPAAVIPRNAPCPCGSGKKAKRCCRP